MHCFVCYGIKQTIEHFPMEPQQQNKKVAMRPIIQDRRIGVGQELFHESHNISDHAGTSGNDSYAIGHSLD